MTSDWDDPNIEVAYFDETHDFRLYHFFIWDHLKGASVKRFIHRSSRSPLTANIIGGRPWENPLCLFPILTGFLPSCPPPILSLAATASQRVLDSDPLLQELFPIPSAYSRSQTILLFYGGRLELDTSPHCRHGQIPQNDHDHSLPSRSTKEEAERVRKPLAQRT
jgi:hypothetical protein